MNNIIDKNEGKVEVPDMPENYYFKVEDPFLIGQTGVRVSLIKYVSWWKSDWNSPFFSRGSQHVETIRVEDTPESVTKAMNILNERNCVKSSLIGDYQPQIESL